MEQDELMTIEKVTDPGYAEVVRVALQAAGIRCELDGEHQAGFTGTFEIGIMVRAKDADRALKIIESVEGKP